MEKNIDGFMFFVISFVVIILLISFLYVVNPGIFHLAGYSIKNFNNNDTLLVEELPVSFKVIEENIIGINTDKDALRFGSTSKWSTGKKSRDITITNPFNVPTEIFINLSENVEEYINPTYTHFYLDSNSTRRFPVFINISDADVGEYEGILTITWKRT